MSIDNVSFHENCITCENNNYRQEIKNLQKYIGIKDSLFHNEIYNGSIDNIRTIVKYIKTQSRWKSNTSRKKLFDVIIHYKDKLGETRTTYATINKYLRTTKNSETDEETFKKIFEFLDELEKDESLQKMEPNATLQLQITEDKLKILKISNNLNIDTESSDSEFENIKSSHLTNNNESISFETERYIPFIDLKMNKLHINRIKTLQNLLGRPNKDNFNVALFIDNVDDTIEKIKILKQANSTKLSTITALCIASELVLEFDVRNKYKQYQFEQQAIVFKENITRTVPSFETLVPKLKQILYDSCESKPLRILALFILSNINDDLTVSENEIGVIRPSDFNRTKFIDTECFSYFDLNTLTWHIKTMATKNKVSRDLKISQKTVDEIKKIYQEIPEDMLTTNKGTKYKTPGKQLFQDKLGITYNEIRSSYFTWRARNAKSIEELEKLCFNEGHMLSTAIDDYYRQYVV